MTEHRIRDMEEVIAAAMVEHGKEMDRIAARLLARPSKTAVFPSFYMQANPSIPPGEIHFQQYGVTIGIINNIGSTE